MRRLPRRIRPLAIALVSTGLGGFWACAQAGPLPPPAPRSPQQGSPYEAPAVDGGLRLADARLRVSADGRILLSNMPRRSVASRRPASSRRVASSQRVASQRVTSTAASQWAASPRVRLGLTRPAPTSRRVAVPIEDPGGRGLAPFFHALSELSRGRIRRLRISHWGDSHVAGSVLTGRLRDRLQRRYGDAGPGFVLLGRPWPTYRQAAAKQGVRRHRRWRSERLWTHYSRRHPRPRDDLFGLPGISVYTRHRAQTWVEPRRGRVDAFDLYYLRQPGGGRVDIVVDGRLQRRVFTLGSRRGPGFARVELGRPARRIEFRTAGGEVRLYGVDLWRKKAGIIYDAFGINGARADAHLKWNEAFFAAQLRRLSPQLIVLAYGSNEVDADRVVAARWERLFEKVVRRLRKALPSAACLVLGPPDQARRRRGQPFQLTDRLSRIITAQRRVALRRGCAFWDQRKAMGGPGSIFHWVAADPPLARTDHVHLYGSGYRRLGDALFEALQAAARAAPSRRRQIPKLPQQSGSVEAPTGSR